MSSGDIPVVNPYSGEKIGTVPRGVAEDVDRAVVEAAEGARAMRDMPLHRRAEILARTGRILLEETEPIARLIVSEAGKTIREARAEVGRAAGIFQLAAEETRRLHGETLPFDAMPNGEGRTGYWTLEPVGIVGAITPWNVPLALTAHKVGPALGAGNAVVHKPAEQTPLNALRLYEILCDCGLPPLALRVVTGTGEEAGDALVRHPDVPFVSFTGSREVGTKLPGRAGYKRVALELGGNSPVIVTPGADIAVAAAAIVKAGFAVAGQLCISVQRVIAHRSILDTLERDVVDRVQKLVAGDPMDERTDVGPLIDARACERVAGLVDDARRSGARVLAGGSPVRGSLYAPTVLTDVPPAARMATEEAFAPLLIFTPYETLDEAIAIANATPYGLNAGVYTESLAEAMKCAREIVAGSVMINDVPSFRSDLMPYGGRKQSGLGREGVRFAMEEMTERKVICFNNLH